MPQCPGYTPDHLSQSMGAGPRHQWFLRLSRWFHCAARDKSHWLTDQHSHPVEAATTVQQLCLDSQGWDHPGDPWQLVWEFRAQSETSGQPRAPLLSSVASSNLSSSTANSQKPKYIYELCSFSILNGNNLFEAHKKWLVLHFKITYFAKQKAV